MYYSMCINVYVNACVRCVCLFECVSVYFLVCVRVFINMCDLCISVSECVCK